MNKIFHPLFNISLYTFSCCLILLVVSCDHQPDKNPETTLTVDTANPIVVVDSARMSIATGVRNSIAKPLQDAVATGSDTSSPKIVFYTKENFSGESDTISIGGYYQGLQKALTESQVSKYAGGIRSLKVSFGISADITFITTAYEAFKNLAMGIVVQIYSSKYYAPGEYSSIEANLVRPKAITLYPWTDFYFSTDDPSIPAQIQFIGLTYQTNDQGQNKWGGKNPLGDSISLSSTKEVYTKSFVYQIPKSRKARVWLATQNGNSSWNYNIDTANRLWVNLNINNNAIFSPRNWVGVRASLD